MNSPAQSRWLRFRNHWVGLCVLGALVVFAYQASADKDQKDVGIAELAPLQTDAGLAEAHEKAESWISEAKLRSQARGTPVRDELVKVLNREGRTGFTAYVSPDGKFRPDDGHHKVIAAREAMRRYRIEPSEVRWSVNVKGDYSDESWDKFAKEMRERNLGYFSKDILEESDRRGETPGELYRRHLPADFSEIHDSPMRSAIGRLFEVLGLKGSAFNPNVQFAEGDRMTAAGVVIKSGEEFSAGTQARLQSELFEGKASGELRKTLLSNALPESKADVDAKLTAGEKLLQSLRTSVAEKPPAARLACFLKGFRELMAMGVSLPSTLPLPADSNLYRSLFSQARRTCADEVDFSRIQTLIGEIADRDTSKFSGSDKKYLKDARKKALALRSAYRLLSDDQKPPRPYKDFVKDLGDVNDRIARWDMSDKPNKALVESARQLKGDLKDEGLLDHGFQPATPQDFLEHQREEIKWLKDAITDSKLTVDKYHDIRKAVRDYKFLFELLNAKAPRVEYASASAFLSDLSKRMGKVKDGLLEDDEDDDNDSNGDKLTSIEPGIRLDLQKFLRMMDKAIGGA